MYSMLVDPGLQHGQASYELAIKAGVGTVAGDPYEVIDVAGGSAASQARDLLCRRLSNINRPEEQSGISRLLRMTRIEIGEINLNHWR